MTRQDIPINLFLVFSMVGISTLIKQGIKGGIKGVGKAFSKAPVKMGIGVAGIGVGGAAVISALNGGNLVTDIIGDILGGLLGIDIPPWLINVMIIAVIVLVVIFVIARMKR